MRNNELKKRIISSIILIPVIFFFVIKGSLLFTLLLIIIFLISYFEWHKMSKNRPYYIPGLIFLFFSFYSIYQLRIYEENSLKKFLIILIICILTDLGGYIFGKTLKGPKLISYSPNKTFAGLVGSYLFPICLVPFLNYINQISENEKMITFFFVIIISTVSQVGDIIISYFKRKSNIKDTGKLIPGHGGLLDRIDGMVFAFPFGYLIMSNNLLTIF